MTMPSRPDLREIASNVKDAFADADRETLLDILTFVIKEYVVEGPPPMLVHQAETLADLKAPTFAELIAAMQTRFDHPELAMFVIDGEQVGVRIGGVVQALLPSRQPMAAPTAEPPRPRPGVHVVETTLQQRPTPAAPATPARIAPPPSRGLSIRGQSGASPGPSPAPAPAAPSSPAPSGPAAPSAAPVPPAADKPEPSGDDASARFSLLELD
jgi:hypothetical protein